MGNGPLKHKHLRQLMDMRVEWTTVGLLDAVEKAAGQKEMP